MPITGPTYPYGGGPLGVEVGQRTPAFAADWPVRATASLYPRDVRTPTLTRQRACLVRGTYGLRQLPVWVNGSSRSFPLSGDALQFPDRSFWRILRDLLYTDPLIARVYAARFASDSAGLLSGPFCPYRQAYLLSVNAVPAGGLSLPDGTAVRRADSTWTSSARRIPSTFPSSESALVFRCLDPLTWSQVTNASGLIPLSGLPASCPDAPAVCIWNDARSLSDDAYIPPAMSAAPVAPGFDLAAGVLPSPDISPLWLPYGGGAGIPAPRHPSAVLARRTGLVAFLTLSVRRDPFRRHRQRHQLPRHVPCGGVRARGAVRGKPPRDRRPRRPAERLRRGGRVPQAGPQGRGE